MTETDVIRAGELLVEIKELDLFISRAEMVWTGRLVKQETRYIFRFNAYGYIDEADYELDTELKNQMLSVLKKHLNKLKEELKGL